MLTLYARQCAPCKMRSELRLVKRFAKQHGMDFKIKRTLASRLNLDEANRLSDVPQPYVYNDQTSTAVHLFGATESDLQKLL